MRGKDDELVVKDLDLASTIKTTLGTEAWFIHSRLVIASTLCQAWAHGEE